MARKNFHFWRVLAVCLALAGSWAWANAKVTKLAEQLLYGDPATRMEAIQAFNKLPPEAQYRLVPDFMVALSDDDPEVRRIAGRILKVMGVNPQEKPQAVPQASSAAADADKWADLKKMRHEESGRYDDLKAEFDQDKKKPVLLDPAQLRAEAPQAASLQSTLLNSLKDPDPWVRAQAARRLSFIQPAPMEAIPLLIKMLGDKEVESRRAAVAALGSFGHLGKEAIMPLNTALSDPDSGVRTLAAESLKQIKQEPQ